MVLWQKLADGVKESSLVRHELDYLRAAFRPHRTYTMDNRRYRARMASKIHKHRTVFVPAVTDEAIMREVSSTKK